MSQMFHSWLQAQATILFSCTFSPSFRDWISHKSLLSLLLCGRHSQGDCHGICSSWPFTNLRYSGHTSPAQPLSPCTNTLQDGALGPSQSSKWLGCLLCWSNPSTQQRKARNSLGIRDFPFTAKKSRHTRWLIPLPQSTHHSSMSTWVAPGPWWTLRMFIFVNFAADSFFAGLRCPQTEIG